MCSGCSETCFQQFFCSWICVVLERGDVLSTVTPTCGGQMFCLPGAVSQKKADFKEVELKRECMNWGVAPRPSMRQMRTCFILLIVQSYYNMSLFYTAVVLILWSLATAVFFMATNIFYYDSGHLYLTNTHTHTIFIQNPIIQSSCLSAGAKQCYRMLGVLMSFTLCMQ